ncbi:MAG: nucleotide sugar dehydrogenase [Candidatus Limnocylindrales bacterium]
MAVKSPPASGTQAQPRVQRRRAAATGRLDVAIVGGGGHVGLPLALSFARAGLRVGIEDLSAETLASIERGQVPFLEAGAEPLLREMLEAGRLEFSTDPALLGRSDIVVIIIGTPIDEFFNPAMTIFERALAQIAPHIRDGSLVVLRSTVYPGTTEYVAKALRDRGRRVDVAFCPERIAEGHALEELQTLPQIVGADEPAAGDRAEALFRRITRTIIRTTGREAELAKLLTNTWRYMKFAIANQFFMIAESAGVDYGAVLDAVRQDYPRAADLPGPGFAAGPCLLKDTMQLSAFTPDHFPMGQSAMQINEGMPAFLVGQIKARHGELRGRTVGILGMAFKAESDDTRASLSYKLRKLLAWEGARVLCTDPYVRDPKLVPLEQVLAEADLFVVGAPHHRYRGLDFGGCPVVDVWGSVAGRIVI